MKNRKFYRLGCEQMPATAAMAEVIREKWIKITVDEINREISRLSNVILQWIQQVGGNRYEA